jgi:hypothetical protein
MVFPLFLFSLLSFNHLSAARNDGVESIASILISEVYTNCLNYGKASYQPAFIFDTALLSSKNVIASALEKRNNVALLRHYNRALKKHPHDIGLRMDQATLFYWLNDIPTALKNYNEIIHKKKAGTCYHNDLYLLRALNNKAVLFHQLQESMNKEMQNTLEKAQKKEKSTWEPVCGPSKTASHIFNELRIVLTAHYYCGKEQTLHCPVCNHPSQSIEAKQSSPVYCLPKYIY